MSDEEERNRDVLDEAFAALRDATSSKDGAATSAAETRRAILARAAKTTRRRRTLIVRLVLPLAAVLAASTAWAAATGRLPKVMGAIAEVFAPAPERSSSVESPHGSVAISAPTVVDASVAAAVGAADADVVVLAQENASTSPSSSPLPRASVAAASAATSSAKPSSATSPAADAEETLYRTAHEAHFTQRDWSKALTGWDAYLAAHPKGRFAPEARYNRALTLVRLGRRDEARAALFPFADGAAFGGYRQKEAKALLDAME